MRRINDAYYQSPIKSTERDGEIQENKAKCRESGNEHGMGRVDFFYCLIEKNKHRHEQKSLTEHSYRSDIAYRAIH